MKTNILTSAKSGLTKIGYATKKHSPEILMVSGVIGVVGATVLACKATLKASDILESTKSDLDDIHKVKDMLDNGDDVDYSEKDYQKDLCVAYAKSGMAFAKLYAPAVIVGGLSIASIVASSNIQRKRIASLAAAYATVDKGFKEYRQRVVERFGAEVDEQLKYGLKSEKITETEVDENGKEIKVKKKVDVVDPENVSDYSVCLTKQNCYIFDSEDYMASVLEGVQKWATLKLRAQGYLPLSEVYNKLECDLTPEQVKAGMVVGWVNDATNDDSDCYVQINLKRTYIRDVNGDLDKAYIVSFNVDGYIWDRITPDVVDNVLGVEDPN